MQDLRYELDEILMETLDFFHREGIPEPLSDQDQRSAETRSTIIYQDPERFLNKDRIIALLAEL
jgi:hypothetical protein